MPSPLKRIADKLIEDYGPEVIATARRVLGMDAEPEQIERAAKVITRRADPAQAAKAPVKRKPALPAPKKQPTYALPPPKGYKHPVREGWSVQDRGEHAPLRYQVVRPGGEAYRSPTQDERQAWNMASNAANAGSNLFKPRGGQWFPDARLGTGAYGRSINNSPEAFARRLAEDQGLIDTNPLRDEPPADVKAVQDWWLRAVPKYLKNDMATETDPLRELAARNLLHIPDLDPEQWTRMANSSLLEDPIGYYTVPPHANNPDEMWGGEEMRGALSQAAPWLAKQPVTDSLFGIERFADGNLEFDHVLDEVRNALDPDSGFPEDLALRPESLQRMSFPQAVERVGRINQWRVKRMEDEALAKMVDNPAIHTFKEYPDAGFRWVEMKPPGTDNAPPDALAEALKAEGDAMGHCVGGYCPDVEEGRSRIFSLRDAKGNPHVTIETSPQRFVFSDVVKAVGQQRADELYNQGLSLENMAALAGMDRGEDIIQIKGKQNRKPVDDYLPYVQDFVKSGTWGDIGDFGNTDLVKLPDGRYITLGQLDEGLAKRFGDADDTKRSYFKQYGSRPEEWEQYSPYFEGFAVGGRVSADRCFSRNPMAVRR